VVEHRVERNQAFGLEADVDDDMLVGDLDDGAGDDGLIGGQRLGGVLLSGLLAVEALECLGEVFIAVLGLGVGACSRDLWDRIGRRMLRCGTAGVSMAGLGERSVDSATAVVSSGVVDSSVVFRGLLSGWKGIWSMSAIG
jgi:hypothetical protein